MIQTKDLASIVILHEQWKRLTEHIHELEKEDSVYLGITFRGTYQKPKFLDKIRPYVIEELKQERQIIEEQLNAFGVSTQGEEEE